MGASIYHRIIHGLRSIVYETGIAVINYAGSIVTSLIGFGLSSAADLVNKSSAANPPTAPQLPYAGGCRVFNPQTGLPIINPNISCVVDFTVIPPNTYETGIGGKEVTRAMAVGAAIIVPAAAFLALLVDLIKNSDRLNDLWVNPAMQSPTPENPIPSQNSRFRSLLKRMWPLLITYASASIGGLILGYTSSNDQWVIFTTAAMGSIGSIVIGGGAILGAREGKKKLDRDQARKQFLTPTIETVPPPSTIPPGQGFVSTIAHQTHWPNAVPVPAMLSPFAAAAIPYEAHFSARPNTIGAPISARFQSRI